MKTKLYVFYIAILTTIQGHSLNRTIQEIFTEEFKSPLNNPSNSRSIPLTDLISLTKELSIQTVLDAGCGTPLFLANKILEFNYTGIDLVEALIEKNTQTTKLNQCNFLIKDITQDPLPKSDLILCQNTLNQFSYFDIFASLENFKNSKSTYLLLFTSPKETNAETRTGIQRPLNFEAAPFFFPKPIQIIQPRAESDDILALWKLEDLDLSSLKEFLFEPLTILSKGINKPFRWEHAGVTNSLRRGLPKVHNNFNINPDNFNLVNRHVLVVSDLEAGHQSYELKQAGQVHKLLVGPNIVGSLNESNSFITWPLIDGYITPSEWVSNNFKVFSSKLENRTFEWFAGVDESYWKPTKKFKEKTTSKVLLYRKTNPELSNQVAKILKDSGFEVISIQYGSYKTEEYKKLLNECKFAVFVSISESQGIALAEAWSMDVPTLVWDSNASIFYAGFTYKNTSAAPYLSAMTGKSWKTTKELQDLISSIEEDSKAFQPRRWVLLNMTDKISSESLLSLFRRI